MAIKKQSLPGKSDWKTQGHVQLRWGNQLGSCSPSGCSPGLGNYSLWLVHHRGSHGQSGQTGLGLLFSCPPKNCSEEMVCQLLPSTLVVAALDRATPPSVVAASGAMLLGSQGPLKVFSSILESRELFRQAEKQRLEKKEPSTFVFYGHLPNSFFFGYLGARQDQDLVNRFFLSGLVYGV